jgi:penicillin-binding protein-related factor A (putative recombinase)
MFSVSQPNLSWLIAKQGAKFALPQLPDRILLSKKLNLCFELKMCQGLSFATDRLKPHQRSALEKFAKYAGKAFLLFGFNHSTIAIAIGIFNYERIVQGISTKVIHYPADFPAGDFLEIPVEIPKSQPRLNLSIFLPPKEKALF